MARGRRANGAGSVYIKHGSYYGGWLTADGGHANRIAAHAAASGTREPAHANAASNR